MEKEFFGHCPKLNCDYTVSASYSSVPILGNLKENFKRTSLNCEYDSEFSCEFFDECPLFKHFPITL